MVNVYEKGCAASRTTQPFENCDFGCELKNQTADSTVCKELLYASKGQLTTLKVYFTTPGVDPYFFSGLIIETVIWFFCFRSSLANFWTSFAVIPLTICS